MAPFIYDESLKTAGQGNFNYSGRNQSIPKPLTGYACKDITVSGSVVDYSLKDNTDLFSNVSEPVQMLLRNGSAAISFKLNNSTNDPIPIVASDYWGIDGFVISDILVTVSGGATMNIYTQGWR
jgi:hypothetical protein